MFCDLVDSTSLSARLDPEDLRDIVRAYQTASAGIIQKFGGYIAQYLGDGILVYFGYPAAHEDDAWRAITSGLEIVTGMAELNQTIAARHNAVLAVRIGVHTGHVVSVKLAPVRATSISPSAKRPTSRPVFKPWRRPTRCLPPAPACSSRVASSRPGIFDHKT